MDGFVFLLILMILMLIGSAYKVIKIWLNQRACPDDEALVEVISGLARRNDPETQRIISHLGICEKCQEKVRKFNEKN